MLQRVLALIVLIGCLQFHPFFDEDPITSSNTPAQGGAESSGETFAPLVARFLWDDAPAIKFREEVDRDVHTLSGEVLVDDAFLGDAWIVADDLMLARYFWGEEEESKEDKDAEEPQPEQFARYLWQESSSEGNQKGFDLDKDVRPTDLNFVGDAWMTNDNLMLARYLWEEQTGPSAPEVPEVSRFLWQETPSSNAIKDDLNKDVQPYVGDAWTADDGLMLARYLWEEEQGDADSSHHEPARFLRQETSDPTFMEAMDKEVRPESEVKPETLLARYLWEEEGQSTPPKPELARYLWEDESGRSTPPEPVTARYLWEEEGQTTPPEPELARYLWEEEGQSTPPKPELARYLWEDESGQSTPPEPVTARYLWEEEGQTTPPKPELARYLWDEATQDKDVQPKFIGDAWMADDEVLLSRYLWQEERGVPTPDVPATARYLWQEAERVRNDADRDVQPFMGDAHVGDREQLMARYLWEDQGSKASSPSETSESKSYVVTGRNYEAMMAHLAVIGATPTATLPAMNAAEVDLTDAQLARLSRDRVHGLMPNTTLQTASVTRGKNVREKIAQRETEFSKLVDADVLHREGLTGEGVGIAVIDTGIWKRNPLERDTRGEKRVVAYYDAINDTETNHHQDQSGHGSHIASVLASSIASVDKSGRRTGSYHGIAPDADLIVVRSFDETGNGSYMDVIRGINYVIENKDKFNIRVMNLSFSGTPMSHYWEDPINQAVMKAWQAGIMVVASSGNSGPDPLSIGVPGNVPYIMTVGAMTDSYTPEDTSDDVLASFSAVGPTLEGHIKPDLIAPGGHLVGVMALTSAIAKEHPEFHDGGRFFEMSGTSQASAVASGIAALMIQLDPSLKPDDIKCRMMSSAKTATTGDGELAYSVFQQGSGLINALDAVLSESEGCVNQGLNIAADIAGEMHFGGPAQQDEDGAFYVDGVDGFEWEGTHASRHLSNAGQLWKTGHIWNVGHLWRVSNLENVGHIWNTAHLWNASYAWDTSEIESGGTYASSYEANGYLWKTGHLWKVGHIWNTGQLWNVSDLSSVHSASVNDWVAQE